mgnify:CR=1 FL=1|jgi:hypothetical protein
MFEMLKANEKVLGFIAIFLLVIGVSIFIRECSVVLNMYYDSAVPM